MFNLTSSFRLMSLSNPQRISLMLSLVSGWVTSRAGSIMQTSLTSSTQFEFCSFPSFDTLLTQTSQHTSACSAFAITGKERKQYVGHIPHHCCQGWSQLYAILNLYLQGLFWTLILHHFSVFCHHFNQADLKKFLLAGHFGRPDHWRHRASTTRRVLLRLLKFAISPFVFIWLLACMI